MAVRTRLTQVLQAQKLYGKSRGLLRDLVENQEDNLGQDHIAAWNARSNLAVNLFRQGRFDEASSELQTVLERQLEVTADTDAVVLKTKNNLANIKMAMQKYDEAWKLHKEVLEARKALFGSRHPDAICSMFNMACVGSKAGWAKEGLRMLQEAANYGFHDEESVKMDPDFLFLRKTQGKEVRSILKQIQRNRKNANDPFKGLASF